MRRFPLPARLAPLAAMVGGYLLIGLVLRIVLQLGFGTDAGVSPLALPRISLLGTLNDAVESLYLFAPAMLLMTLLPERVWRSRVMRVALPLGVAATFTVFVFLGVAEYFFFDEFDARFNIVAFDYLMYPSEVVGDIRAEYPLGPVILGALAMGATLSWAMRRWLHPEAGVPVRRRKRLAFAAGWLGAIALVYPLWPSDLLSFSSNRIDRELTQNGHSTFFRAAVTSELDYGAYYVTAPPEDAWKRLTEHLSTAGGRFVALDQGRLDREFAADPEGLGKLNVVVVSSESFGAEFSRLYGSSRDWTPNFDRFAREGLQFANAYASGARTVRGLEAMTCSLPPIPPVSVVRRPGGARVSDWGTVMRGLGYHTSFVYGGFGYFDNMNAFYSSNGFEVIDRGSIEHPRFANVWGVADEDLFDRALTHFDEVHAKGTPFFSIVMTTSNHKPFTFRTGLEAQGIKPKGGGRESGVRYADHALGYFLDEARKHSWFDDTLFVVIADHGARVYGRQDIPLKTYEIPAMIWAPKHVKPRRIDTLFGQIDLAPTVLGMLGLPYTAPFFGVDVLKHPEAARVAVFNHNHDIALMQDSDLVVMGLNRAEDFLRYDKDANTYANRPRDANLEQLAIAYYQTASQLFRDGKF